MGVTSLEMDSMLEPLSEHGCVYSQRDVHFYTSKREVLLGENCILLKPACFLGFSLFRQMIKVGICLGAYVAAGGFLTQRWRYAEWPNGHTEDQAAHEESVEPRTVTVVV